MAPGGGRRGRGRTSIGRASRCGAHRVRNSGGCSEWERGSSSFGSTDPVCGEIVLCRLCLCQGSQDLHWLIISYHQSHVTLHCLDNVFENKLIPTSKLSGNDGATPLHCDSATETITKGGKSCPFCVTVNGLIEVVMLQVRVLGWV